VETIALAIGLGYVALLVLLAVCVAVSPVVLLYYWVKYDLLGYPIPEPDEYRG